MKESRQQKSPPVRLGILQAGRVPEELEGTFPDYNQIFVDLLGEHEFEYLFWPVLDGVFPESVDAADAWLITGSKFGAYEDHDWIAPLEDFIRTVFAANAPMVGICFGHQVIAQAMGGKVEKFAGGWSVGRVEYALDESVFGQTVAANEQSGNAKTPLLAFHQDQVTQAPEMATTIGSTDFCKHAALLYDNRILTLQPHPEFTQPYIAGLLSARGELLPDDIKQQASARLKQSIVREPIAETLRDFLKRQSA